MPHDVIVYTFDINIFMASIFNPWWECRLNLESCFAWTVGCCSNYKISCFVVVVVVVDSYDVVIIFIWFSIVSFEWNFFEYTWNKIILIISRYILLLLFTPECPDELGSTVITWLFLISISVRMTLPSYCGGVSKWDSDSLIHQLVILLDTYFYPWESLYK